MSRERAIKIVKDLTQTINKVKKVKHRIVKVNKNEMFHDPKISLATLVRKKAKLVEKYEIKKEEYAVT
tara:strand:+ start:741 stop:944 length:204 start_codon:yes stop_codon:yes gene_type:complete